MPQGPVHPQLPGLPRPGPSAPQLLGLPPTWPPPCPPGVGAGPKWGPGEAPLSLVRRTVMGGSWPRGHLFYEMLTHRAPAQPGPCPCQVPPPFFCFFFNKDATILFASLFTGLPWPITVQSPWLLPEACCSPRPPGRKAGSPGWSHAGQVLVIRRARPGRGAGWSPWCGDGGGRGQAGPRLY